MKKWVWVLSAIVLIGCTNIASKQSNTSEDGQETIIKTLTLKDFGPAPELHNEVWLNTDSPLRLSELKGKVVLLEMWTFG